MIFHKKIRVCFLLPIIVLSAFISNQASAQKKKVACVGNSITYGYDLPNPLVEGYPGQMQALLGTDDWAVANYGASGRTMLKAGGYSYWNDPLYQNALASNPDIVIIGLGTNDSKRWLWDANSPEFEADYTEMVQSFEDLASKPDIWIFLLIPGEKQDWDIYNSYIKDKVNPEIKKIALQNGLGLIDLYAALGGRKPEWYLEDNVHPSVTGAGLIAQTVSDALLMGKPEVSFINDKVIAAEGYDYQWYIDGIPVASDKGGTQKEMTVTKSGAYKVSVRPDENSESRIVSEELLLTITVTATEIITQSGIRVYPNPAFNVLYVDHHALPKGDYMIIDISGKIQLSGKISGHVAAINMHSLASGTYILSMGNERIKLSKR